MGIIFLLLANEFIYSIMKMITLFFLFILLGKFNSQTLFFIFINFLKVVLRSIVV